MAIISKCIMRFDYNETSFSFIVCRKFSPTSIIKYFSKHESKLVAFQNYLTNIFFSGLQSQSTDITPPNVGVYLFNAVCVLSVLSSLVIHKMAEADP